MLSINSTTPLSSQNVTFTDPLIPISHKQSENLSKILPQIFANNCESTLSIDNASISLQKDLVIDCVKFSIFSEKSRLVTELDPKHCFNKSCLNTTLEEERKFSVFTLNPGNTDSKCSKSFKNVHSSSKFQKSHSEQANKTSHRLNIVDRSLLAFNEAVKLLAKGEILNSLNLLSIILPEHQKEFFKELMGKKDSINIDVAIKLNNLRKYDQAQIILDMLSKENSNGCELMIFAASLYG
jgi:hypothetical protein